MTVLYIIIALLILLSIKPLSFAKFNWRKKQYLGAIGMILIVLLMMGLPIYVLLTR